MLCVQEILMYSVFPNTRHGSKKNQNRLNFYLFIAECQILICFMQRPQPDTLSKELVLFSSRVFYLNLRVDGQIENQTAGTFLKSVHHSQKHWTFPCFVFPHQSTRRGNKFQHRFLPCTIDFLQTRFPLISYYV